MKCPNPKKKQQQKMFSCLPDRICTSCKIQNSLENLIIPYLKVSHQRKSLAVKDLIMERQRQTNVETCDKV